jgi:hypothetical protein
MDPEAPFVLWDKVILEPAWKTYWIPVPVILPDVPPVPPPAVEVFIAIEIVPSGCTLCVGTVYDPTIELFVR